MKKERLSNLTSAIMMAFVIIALVLPRALVAGSLEPQSDFTLQLSQNELGAVAEVLTSSGSRQYSYRVIGVKETNKGTRDFHVLSDEKVKGLFLMRNSEYLLKLGRSFYDDGLGNLVVMGTIWNGIAPVIPYSVTYTAFGDFAYGFGSNDDGVVDVALGGSGTDSFWILATEDFEQLLECLEQRAAEGLLGAASLCIQCIEANRPSGPVSAEDLKCGDSESGRDFGGGGNFHDFLDALREPECSESEPGKGITSLSAKARRWLSRLETLMNWADSYAVDTTEADDPEDLAYEGVGNALADLAEEYRKYAEDLEDWGAEDSETLESEQRVRNAIGALNAAWSRLEKVLVDAATEDGSNNGTQSAPSERPPIDPLTPPFPGEDPRCQGERTKWEQGSIFGEYCQDKEGHIDPIECIRRMNDSTYSISGGRCWAEIGPDDQKTIVCRSEDDAQRGSESEAESGGVASPGGADSGPNDGLDVNLGGPKTNIHYLDTHPFGGFLLGLGDSGHGPDDPPID